MIALGLTAEQLAERRKYVCAGDAAKVMAGQWREVWLEKTGRAKGDDLSGELRVQLGSFTEPFNLAWAEKVTGRAIEYFSDNPVASGLWLSFHPKGGTVYRQELQISQAYPWMACHLDGMTTTPQGQRCVIDAKHVGQAGEAAILRYTPHGVHQATVMGCDWWALSFIIGNGRHEVVYQEVDPFYQAELITKTREFWSYVERDEEPPDTTSTLAPKPQPKLRQIDLDLTSAEQPNWGPEFRKLARTFAETHGAATAHAIAREDIKKLIPDDVGRVTLGRVTYKRDGRGQTINLEKEKDDAGS